MKILKKDIEWYIERMDEPFSFPGFSDAEWFCLIGERYGNRTGYGQLLTNQANPLLQKTLTTKDMLLAVPECIFSFPQGEQVKMYIEKHLHPEIELYERDMVTDELAEKAGLAPLIKKLRTMKVGVVGNPALKRLKAFDIHEFYPTATNDFHLNPDGMKQIAAKVKKGKCDIYLFACGISAACMIGIIHGHVKATLFDCGSIWDAYVGIGEQREWRAKLYADKEKWDDWKGQNEPKVL